jgi:glycosyltransferase involved in cell wall biosynthesis
VDASAPKVSVVIATFRPGDGITRVFESLDRQTMPVTDFEVVFVDDGSADDTVRRLQQFASGRPNVAVYEIENSGWPSRPRNIGVRRSRGEYVMFMDHDDSLYPDGLRRASEYGLENDADIVNVPEFNTKNAWWGPILAHNIPNAIKDGGIEQLMPFVPHKLYRRRLLLDHDIRFPERPRALWEDWYVNVGAYRHSAVAAVLADTPVYLRHIHGENTSNTFDIRRPDYWERLDDVMEYVSKTLDGPEYRSARAVALARHFSLRILAPLGRRPKTGDTAARMAFGQAQRLLAKYLSDDVFSELGRKSQAQAHLLRAGRADLLVAFHAADLKQRARLHVRRLDWRDGVLAAMLDCHWEAASPDAPILREDGDRVIRDVGPELARAIAPELLDVTDATDELILRLSVRARTDYVSWPVSTSVRDIGYAYDDHGALRLAARGEATLDVETGAGGKPLPQDVWDLKYYCGWAGMARTNAPVYSGPAKPIVRSGRAATAYANASSNLSLDLAQTLRTLAVDARPRPGPAGPATAFSVPLDNLTTVGDAVLNVSDIVAIPQDRARDTVGAAEGEVGEPLAAQGHLSARVVVDSLGARLEGSADLAPGVYVVFARRGGEFHRTARSLVVDDAGQLAFT